MITLIMIGFNTCYVCWHSSVNDVYYVSLSYALFSSLARDLGLHSKYIIRQDMHVWVYETIQGDSDNGS